MRIITSLWAIWKQQQRCWMTLPKSDQASAWASIQHQACLALFLCSDHSSTLLKWQLASCFVRFVQTWSSDNGWKYSHTNDLVSFWARLVELKYLFNVLTHISWKRAFFPSLRFSSAAGLELKCSMNTQQYDFKLLAAVQRGQHPRTWRYIYFDL